MNRDKTEPVSFLFDGNIGTVKELPSDINIQAYDSDLLFVSVPGLAFKVRGPASLKKDAAGYYTLRAWTKSADAKAKSGLGSHAFGCSLYELAVKYTNVSSSKFVTSKPTDKTTEWSIPFWLPEIGLQTINTTTSTTITEDTSTYAKWGFTWTWLTSYLDDWGAKETTSEKGYSTIVHFDTSTSTPIGTIKPLAKVWMKYRVSSDLGAWINAYPQFQAEEWFHVNVVK